MTVVTVDEIEARSWLNLYAAEIAKIAHEQATDKCATPGVLHHMPRVIQMRMGMITAR